MKVLFITLALMFSVSCAWNVDQAIYREKLQVSVIAGLLIEEYEVRLGDLPARCPDHLRNVVYVGRGEKFLPGSDFALGIKDGVSGQHYYDQTSYIWIGEHLSPVGYNATLVHELIHALLACVTDPGGLGRLVADTDRDHNEPDIWCTEGHECGFDGSDNEDSLEYAVVEMARYWDPTGHPSAP